MDAQVKKTKAEESLAGQFEAGRDKLPGGAWAKALRDTAFDRYSVGGLPHRRVEEWKYTDLRASLREAYPPAPPVSEALARGDIDKALGGDLAALDSYRLVIIDGLYRPELSDAALLEGAAELLSLGDALDEPPAWFEEVLGKVNAPDGDAVIALNAALMSGGVVVRVAAGSGLDKPIHIVHVQAARVEAGLTTRNVICVGEGEAATILESYVTCSDAGAQRNAVTELVAGDGASVDHIKFQDEGSSSVHLSSWLTRLGQNVTYRAFQLSTGAALARNQVFVEFAGEGSVSHVSSAVLARRRQHNDTTLVIDHAVPECESREFNKAVLDDEARGIVQCKVNVHRDAQKSDGHQMAHGLLLSEAVEFDSKPELEIFADDVVCGHGSTSGQVDEQLMFYLRSRGIPEDQARALLITAFVGDAIEKVENEAIRAAFLARAEAWVEAGEQ